MKLKTKTHFKLSGYDAASTQLKIMDQYESKLHFVLDGSRKSWIQILNGNTERRMIGAGLMSLCSIFVHFKG